MEFDEAIVKLFGRSTKKASEAGVALIERAILGSEPKHRDCLLRFRVRSSSGPRNLAFDIEFGASGEFKTRLELVGLRKLAPNTEKLLLSILSSAFNIAGDTDSQLDAHDTNLSSVFAELRTRYAELPHGPRVGEILRRLDSGMDVISLGPSASGKTVSGVQVAAAIEGRGQGISWIDCAQPFNAEYALLRELCRFSRKDGYHLVVLDNLQSNLGGFSKLFGLVQVLTKAGIDLRLLGLGWESVHGVAADIAQLAVFVPSKGEDVIRLLIQHYSQHGITVQELNDISQLVDGDLVLARLLVEERNRTGHLPSEREIPKLVFAEIVGGYRPSSDEIQVLYFIACMGQFEVGVSRPAAAAISRDGTDTLIGLGILRYSGPLLSVGHRSLARALLEYCLGAFHELIESVGTPVDVVVRYLRSAGNEQILALLEILELLLVPGAPNKDVLINGEARFLSRSWKTIRILVARIDSLVQQDSTFGDNIATAVFGAEALSAVHSGNWYRVADFVRKRWRVIPEALPEPIASPTSERLDFDQIHSRMKTEEAAQVRGPDWQESAGEIDLDRFHRTWALGLLLGFEGLAPTRDSERLSLLKGAAKHAQLPEGSFYPNRVPWVTARVLLGLADTGETISTSKVLRDGCRWLTSALPDGPCDYGTWKSGTGSWNSTLQTTAMVSSALTRAGIHPNHWALNDSLTYLINARDTWSKAGSEIDAAIILDTLLAGRCEWTELQGELGLLLRWLEERDTWSTASVPNPTLNAESSKVLFIASCMVRIIWSIVRSNLHLMLDAAMTKNRTPQLPNPASVQLANQQRLARLRNREDEVEREITKNIDHRLRLAGRLSKDSKVAEELNVWRKREEELTNVKLAISALVKGEALTEGALSSAEEALHSLGVSCFGSAWLP